MQCEACGDAEATCDVCGLDLCAECKDKWVEGAPTWGEILRRSGSEADVVKVYQAYTARWREEHAE